VSTQDKLDIVVSRFVYELTHLIREAAKEQVLAALASSGMATSGRGGRGPKGAAAVETTPSGRRVRRSADQLAQVQDRIVALLGKETKLTSEEIQGKLGLSKEDIFRPLQLLREEGKLKTVGARRSMRYSLGAGRSGVVKRAKKGEAAE
jgi:hypothetical protein